MKIKMVLISKTKLCKKPSLSLSISSSKNSTHLLQTITLCNSKLYNQQHNHMTTFDLPPELLQILPSDPFEQLDFARKITSIALFTRISSLESESSILRQQLTDKNILVEDLNAHVRSLNAALSDVVDKLSRADHEKVSSTLVNFI